MRRFLFLPFLLCSVCLPGCASSPSARVSVPALPAWQQPAAARTYTAAEVVAECQRLAPGAQVIWSDATFTPLAHEWLVAAVAWADEFAWTIGLTYTSESHDCDKFALGVGYAANIAAARAGVRAQPLLARIHVRQEAPFGGIPGGAGGHALNAFLSDRGYYVLEPQRGGAPRLVPFDQYPNRHAIFRILIGG